ncbi:membrane-spanning 4-domains subfamily A member 12-like [Eptesicus fuscus]|uniref:membrane-spanning 4-domains subfamily A member 12-like n=1 Tax=Eptesicus fuscus TaxID=29078 RepID=UPI002403E4D2|nr:membrane-spanning 4-domains subfamily A member 12-like [Eptesicus fuscus]
MPRNQLRIRKETRILGAIQIVTGLICNWLGVIWTYLFTTQKIAFGKVYLPVVAITGYPYWASLTFLSSGLLTIMLEKNQSWILVSYAIAVNIISASIAIFGLLLLSFEFLTFNLNSTAVLWSQTSGKMLSQYLFIFITLELIVACIVTHWACKAKYRR